MQVSNELSPNTNGKIQLSQPVGGGYVGGLLVAVHTARNPVHLESGPNTNVSTFDLNVTVSVLVLVMMVHGSDVCPQCLEMKLSKFSSTQSSLHEVSSSILKCRNVILTLCPSSTSIIQVYTNTNNLYQMHNFYHFLLPHQHFQDSLEDTVVKILWSEEVNLDMMSHY